MAESSHALGAERCYRPTRLILAMCLALLGLAGIVGVADAQRCSTGCQLVDYVSSVSRDASGPLDLKAFVFYPNNLPEGSETPVAVVMHQYSASSTFGLTRARAERLANEGFVAVLVAMRGRDGSDGVRDSGGLEIYDIYDAVEHLKRDAFFEPRIDPTNVHITGYSGGGGNAMSALTKFPDYFRLGSSYFGIADYGHDPVNGWYVNGANVGGTRTRTLDVDVGNPVAARLPGGDPAVLDRYLARASNLASRNNPYSEIHLFVNTDETISPPWNSVSYRDAAVSQAADPDEFSNITVHLGESDGSLWVDHNADSNVDDNEIQSFPHGDSAGSQRRGEAWYLDRLRAGEIPQPRLNDADELFVAGWVRTAPFELFLGDGQDAAGLLDYELSDAELSFRLRVESSDKTATGRLSVDATRLAGESFHVVLNGQRIGSSATTEPFVYSVLGDGDVLRLVSVPEPTSTSLLVLASILGFAGKSRRSN